MNINKVSKQIAVFALGFTGFFFLLGIVGKSDYNEEVIYNMTETAYNVIVDSLGEGCSDTQIVKTYLSNKDYYDSLNW
ncbi:hypothetical protein [Bacteroides sp. OM08-17BH]|jgi:hypothetical protein|uniref:hypothetical protein n=1 Tax=Bacteroides sp. OM08-17BH TaxID=2292285 RepID=UPI000E43E2C6|nr:hypothetical protein [Bacteroides sp. OM08-17BH]RGM25309.1 hypothetical protein DXC20_15060 [Bacteroides sp. OM08-17BH]